MAKQESCFPLDVMGKQDINDLDEVVDYLEGLRNNTRVSFHKCPLCEAQVLESLHNMVKHNIFGCLSQPKNPNHFVVSLSCPHCQKDICVRVGRKWWQIKDVMKSKKERAGPLLTVTRPIDRLVLFVINQIWYRQYEMEEGEPAFLPTGPDECARILILNGKAVGFYTMKQKGSLYNSKDYSVYSLSVLDIMYVCKKYRRHGFATYLLENFISYNLGESVGISAPISQEMYGVLHKFLLKHPDIRDFMWEITYTGEEGYRKNLWHSLKGRLTSTEKIDNNDSAINKKSSETCAEASTDSAAEKPTQSADINDID